MFAGQLKLGFQGCNGGAHAAGLLGTAPPGRRLQKHGRRAHGAFVRLFAGSAFENRALVSAAFPRGNHHGESAVRAATSRKKSIRPVMRRCKGYYENRRPSLPDRHPRGRGASIRVARNGRYSRWDSVPDSPDARVPPPRRARRQPPRSPLFPAKVRRH